MVDVTLTSLLPLPSPSLNPRVASHSSQGANLGPSFSPGQLIKGFVLNRTAQGQPILRTPGGDFTVKSDFFLKIGSEVVVRITGSGQNLRANIISVNGKSPKEANLQHIDPHLKANKAPPFTGQTANNSTAGTTATNSPVSSTSLAGNSQISAQNATSTLPSASTTLQTSPQQTSGTIPTSTSATNITTTPATQPLASTTLNSSASNSALPTNSNTASTQSTSTTTFSSVQTQNVTSTTSSNITPTTPGNIPTTTSSSAPSSPSAQPTANTGSSAHINTTASRTTTPSTPIFYQPYTPAGTSSTATYTGTSPYSTQYVSQGIAPSAPSTLPPEVAQLATSWTSLQQIAAALKELQPTVYTQLERRFPLIQLDALSSKGSVLKDLVEGFVFFLTATKLNSPKLLLGERATRLLQRNGQDELIKRFAKDFSSIRQMFEGYSQQSPWQPLFMPIVINGEFQQARWFFRREKETSDQENRKAKASRFIVEMDYSELGQMQLDGFATTHNEKLKLDMVLRAQTPLEEDIQRDIIAIYHAASEAAGYIGTFSFEFTETFPMNPLDELLPKQNLVV